MPRIFNELKGTMELTANKAQEEMRETQTKYQN